MHAPSIKRINSRKGVLSPSLIDWHIASSQCFVFNISFTTFLQQDTSIIIVLHYCMTVCYYNTDSFPIEIAYTPLISAGIQRFYQEVVLQYLHVCDS